MPGLNTLRGEVELKAHGETFILCAEFGRVAAWCSEISITDMQTLFEKLKGGDPSVLYSGVKNLCVSGNEDKIGTKLLFSDFNIIAEALSAALMAGSDDENPPEAKDKTK